MSLLRDKIERAIESVNDDAQTWRDKPVRSVAQAIHDKLLPEFQGLTSRLADPLPDSDAAAQIDDLKARLETVTAERDALLTERDADLPKDETPEETVEEVAETPAPTKKKKR